MAGVAVADAGVLIAHLDPADLHHTRAGELLTGAASTGELAASPLTIAEVLVGPARAGRLGEASAAVDRLVIHRPPIDAAAGVRLAELRKSSGLKLPDCCVLLAAETVGATAVLTLDGRVGRAAERLGYAGATG